MGNCQNSGTEKHENEELQIAPEENQKTEIKSNESKQVLFKLIAQTWAKDSHNLFDFEAGNKTVDNLNIRGEGYLIRRENKVYYYPQGKHNIQKKGDVLLEIYREGQTYYIKKDSKFYNKKEPWIVIRSIQNKNSGEGYRLRLNDTIKMGRIKLQLTEISNLNQNKSQQSHRKNEHFIEKETKCIQEESEFVDNWNSSPSNNNKTHFMSSSSLKQINPNQAIPIELFQEDVIIKEDHRHGSNMKQKTDTDSLGQGINNENDEEDEKEEKMENEQQKSQTSFEVHNNTNVCRICLQQTQELGNPFVTPCKCIGTMKYIHIECLQQWLKCKSETKNNQYCITLQLKNFECELCKTYYPRVFTSDGVQYDLIELSKPETPYAVFQTVQMNKPNNAVLMNNGNAQFQFGVYILSLNEKKKLNIGRGHDSEIRVGDISVSRKHASINYRETDSSLRIFDEASKFGTIVSLSNDIPITSEISEIQFQCGRTVVQFNFENQNCCLFAGCFTNGNQQVAQNSESDEFEEKDLPIILKDTSIENEIIFGDPPVNMRHEANNNQDPDI